MDDKNLFFLNHILDNISKLESFSKDLTKEGLSRDELKQYAIVRAIEIIGEAAKNISDFFKRNHREIAWKDIIGTRDIIIHKYFGIDLDIVWNILKIDLPNLKNKIKAIVG